MAISIGVLLEIYAKGLLGVGSASFVASVFTLLAVMTVSTMLIDHASIGDAALLILYITYNIWCITRLPPAVENNYMQIISRWISGGSSSSLVSVFNSLVSMFSMEIVIHLVFQMGVFVVAVRLISKSLYQQSEYSHISKESWQDWIFNYLWPTFGKLVLVLVYTFAWLQRIIRIELMEEADNSIYTTIGRWWINPSVWRYVNILFCLFIYGLHLLTPANQPIFS